MAVHFPLTDIDPLMRVFYAYSPKPRRKDFVAFRERHPHVLEGLRDNRGRIDLAALERRYLANCAAVDAEGRRFSGEVEILGDLLPEVTPEHEQERAIREEAKARRSGRGTVANPLPMVRGRFA
jgi:hypothetical protein